MKRMKKLLKKKVGSGYYRRTIDPHKTQPIKSTTRITQWHNIYDVPQNNGVYQCLRSNGKVFWARWLNGRWCCGYDINSNSSFNCAAKSISESFICTSYTKWRGITYV